LRSRHIRLSGFAQLVIKVAYDHPGAFLAKQSSVAGAMPDAAPVITAIFPFNRPNVVGSSWLRNAS